ncbi:Ras-related protein Rab-18 [Golovinomyces cichoracearum]|uniref:Ras-related protein Rab-18 n=1 Tax=Golovinomyces cichoracearum TaxID=62708 RepID=A0A420IT15_9PEZI|nr:Ras-related protein Rab-18 [Golovinomyces cichoracearum]
MASNDSPPTLKILMIGPSGAGKSALLIRYCDDQFDSESSTATIGVDFKIKTASINGTAYRLNLLDTAGQERFRTLSNSYYRNAHAIVLMYDISNRDSFLSLDRWFNEVELNAVPGAVKYLVGCKSDKANMGLRRVSKEEASAKAKSKGAVGWCEVSSKTRENVRRVFAEVVEAVVSDKELMKMGRRGPGVVDVVRNDTGSGSVCLC